MRPIVPLILAVAAVAALPAAAAADAGSAVLAGAAIPRIEPFTAGAVPCGATSCLRVEFRARGDIGPRLVWHLTVVRPDGAAAYDGTGRTRRGRRVDGLLEPSSPPPCGRYRLLLRVTAPGGDHVDASRIVIRRRGCVTPGRPPAAAP
ncbi:MAG TPA: hypothetical protein PKD59_11775 [Miltoncostaeaceae bacterium]|nr:hypothetical protein [Miltoncostaeaceae bacterium]